jgi:hypothetical protein
MFTTTLGCLTLTLSFAGTDLDRLLYPAGAGMHPGMTAAELEQPAAPTTQRTVYVSIGTVTRLQMKSKRPITRVEIDREGIVRVQPAFNDQTTLLITGLQPGRVLLTLYDDAGGKETRPWGK